MAAPWQTAEVAGSSGEREGSLRSGAAVAEALEARGHDVVRIALGDRFGAELGATLQRARRDAAFLALHGRLGEDGCSQGLLVRRLVAAGCASAAIVGALRARPDGEGPRIRVEP